MDRQSKIKLLQMASEGLLNVNGAILYPDERLLIQTAENAFSDTVTGVTYSRAEALRLLAYFPDAPYLHKHIFVSGPKLSAEDLADTNCEPYIYQTDLNGKQAFVFEMIALPKINIETLLNHSII